MQLEQAYHQHLPLIVRFNGEFDLVVIAAIFTPKGIAFFDDAVFSDFAPRPADHYVEGPATGEGPWACGDHRFRVVDRHDPAWEQWQTFIDFTDGDTAGTRARLEPRLRELAQGWLQS